MPVPRGFPSPDGRFSTLSSQFRHLIVLYFGIDIVFSQRQLDEALNSTSDR
jgi:hypothetical protein